MKLSLRSAPEDSSKVKTVVRLGLNASQNRNRTEELKYMQDVLNLSEKIGFLKGIGVDSKHIGRFYAQEYRFDESSNDYSLRFREIKY